MAVKRSDFDRSLKLEYKVLQELDKGILQKVLAEKYSITKNPITKRKKNRGESLECYETSLDLNFFSRLPSRKKTDYLRLFPFRLFP